MPKFIVGYVPVLHKGYLNLFKAFPDVQSIYLIDRQSISDESIDYLRKDLRQLEIADAIKLISGLGRFKKVEQYRDTIRDELDVVGNEIVLPDEDISRIVGSRFKKAMVTYYSVFLRWDRRKLENINVDDSTAGLTDVKHVEYMNKALKVAHVSTDIWRRVGAVLVSKDDQILDSASNRGEPNSLSPWLEGDPRTIFNRGVAIEMSVFSHAEALLVARAAKHGVSLEGASMYVADFPCPACAKLIAHSGISHVYYKNGYAVLDGKRVLDEYEVTLQRVAVDESDEHPEVWVPYLSQ